MDVPMVCMGQKIRGEGYEEGLEAGRCAAADSAAEDTPSPLSFMPVLLVWLSAFPCPQPDKPAMTLVWDSRHLFSSPSYCQARPRA